MTSTKHSSKRFRASKCAEPFDPSVDFSIFYSDSSVKLSVIDSNTRALFQLNDLDRAHFICDKVNSSQRSELKLTQKFTREPPIKYVHRSIFVLEDPSVNLNSLQTQSILYAPNSISVHRNFINPPQSKITLDPNCIERGLRPKVSFRRSPTRHLLSHPYDFQQHLSCMHLLENFPPLTQPHPIPVQTLTHDQEMSDPNLNEFPTDFRDLLLPFTKITPNTAPSTSSAKATTHAPLAPYSSDSNDSQSTLNLSPLNHRDKALLDADIDMYALHYAFSFSIVSTIEINYEVS